MHLCPEFFLKKITLNKKSDNSVWLFSLKAFLAKIKCRRVLLQVLAKFVTNFVVNGKHCGFFEFYQDSKAKSELAWRGPCATTGVRVEAP
jgi:hypothetical protein